MTAVLLTLFSETWEDLVARDFMRPVDRLAQDLLGDPEVGHLLLAEPYRSRPVRWGRAVQGRRRTPFPHPLPQTAPSGAAAQRRTAVSPLRLRRDDPRSVPATRRAYRRYGATVVSQVRAAQPGPVHVVTCNPLVAAFGGLAELGPLTYYARDDFSRHPRYAPSWPAYRAAYAELRQQRTAVAAVSAPLLDALAPTGPNLVLPNGIEPGEWERADPAPAWFTALPGPRLLYTGSLDERLDPRLVAQAAGATAGGSVVLLGPTEVPAHVADLARLPGVHVHAAVGRAELAAVVSAADACILPHVVNGLTTAMSPLKLYEYLAAGRPVVSVDLPPVRGVHAGVELVAPGAPFGPGVARALRRGPLDAAARAAFLAESSWSGRFADLKRFAFGPDAAAATPAG